jgi:hypothetical protein
MVSAVVQVISLGLLTRLSHYADPVAAFFVINAVFQIMWSYVVSYFIITFNDVDAQAASWPCMERPAIWRSRSDPMWAAC